MMERTVNNISFICFRNAKIIVLKPLVILFFLTGTTEYEIVSFHLNTGGIFNNGFVFLVHFGAWLFPIHFHFTGRNFKFIGFTRFDNLVIHEMFLNDLIHFAITG